MRPTDSSPGVSIIIPAWDDYGRVKPTLDYLIPSLDDTGLPYEIIVVADGCSDGTPSLVKAYNRDNVCVLEFPTRLGKGGAIIKGFQQAAFDKMGFLDADSPLRIKEIMSLVGKLNEVEAAIASRWTIGTRPRFHAGTGRNILSVGWSVLSRGMLITKARDTQCGAKFFRARELRQIISKITIRNWAFDLDLLYQWEHAGYSYNEVATAWDDRPGSKLTVWRAMPLMLLSMLCLRLLHSPAGRLFASDNRPYPIKRSIARVSDRASSGVQSRDYLDPPGDDQRA
jgi:dolichol-phosphate mannosyltransferase